MGAGPLLELDGVSKAFGRLTALDRISCRIAPGIITGIIGPNGAGKTTLFNVVTGFVRPDAGRVLLRGRALTGLRPSRISRLGVARSFQELRLFRRMTVAENLQLALCARQFRGVLELLSRRADQQRRDMLRAGLEKVGLWEKRLTPVEELSYGEQKRLEYVRLLATGAPVLLLDEPAAGLDMAEIRALFAIVRETLSADRAICVIEHNIEVIRNLCEQVIVLHLGQKVAEGTPEEVLNNEEVRRVYIGVEAPGPGSGTSGP